MCRKTLRAAAQTRRWLPAHCGAAGAWGRPVYDAWGVRLPLFGDPDPMKGLPEDRFKFLGRGTISETGDIDLIKRLYDPSIGRFTTIDPSPDVEGQEAVTTYQYGLNNPLVNPDPDGDCPSCIVGGISGGLVEYSTQVASNAIREGRLSSDSFTKNKSVSSIGLAIIEGAVTQRASAGKKLLVKTAVVVANNVLDVSMDKYGNLKAGVETNITKIVKNATIDAAAELGVGGVLKPLAKGVDKNIVNKTFNKVVGSEGKKLASGIKTGMQVVGVKINSKINTNIKDYTKAFAAAAPKNGRGFNRDRHKNCNKGTIR